MGSDKLRLIGITSEQRVDFLPDVPTFKELGFPSVTDQTWYALFVRSETPKPIIDKLSALFSASYGESDANVDFFDSDLTRVSAGLLYKF